MELKDLIKTLKAEETLFCNSLDSCCPSHAQDHLNRVWKKSKLLGEALDGDLEILAAAAYLHDLARHTLVGVHGPEGSCYAKPILEKISFPPEKISLVLDAIKEHDNTDPRARISLEAKILYDADKLDSIGAIGVKRWVLHMQRQDLSIDQAINQIHERFEGLHFVESKKLAEQGQNYLLDFFKRLKQENTEKDS